MAGKQDWVAGGALTSNDRPPQEFKQIILNILQEGETVTKALKRLKPPAKKTANKRKTRSTAKTNAEPDTATEDPTEQAERDKQFNALTEAAGELMSLGFEDIYSDTKDDISSNLHSGADQGVSKGGAVWHDDGTVKDEAAKEHAMYQRPADTSALSYQEAAQAGSTDNSPPAAQDQQIPVPPSAAISAPDAASLDAATAADTAAGAPSATETADGAQLPPPVAQPAPSGNASVTQEPASTAAPGPVEHQQGQIPSAEAVYVPQAPQEPTVAAPDSAQVLPASDAEVAAAASHITDTAAPSPAAPAESASNAAKAPEAQQAPTETTHAVLDSEHKVGAPSTDTEMADGSKDTALQASVVPVQQQQPGTSSVAAPPTAQTEAVWKGTAKGPGLGESREFTGGPMNFERPKYRHSPYGPPPIRAGGRFSPAGGRGSPRGRESPTGRSLGRGFNEPPRSSIMRPQYRQQPSQHMHMSPGGYPMPPPYHGGYAPQPPPPAHHPPPYYPPPPQQTYAPPPQQGYPQQQQAYPPPPQQQQPFPPQQYAQPPHYDAQWQQYQETQGQYPAYQQLPAYQQAPAYPPPAAAPPG